MTKFPLYLQPKGSDICGATCLKMIAHYYGTNVELDFLEKLTNTIKFGSSLLALSETAKKIGFNATGLSIKSNELYKQSFFPCIAHVGTFHFVVIYKVKNYKVYIADPSLGFLKLSIKGFENIWLNQKEEMGKLLLIEPINP